MSVRKMPDAHKIGNKWREGMRPANAFTSEQARTINLVPCIVVKCFHCGLDFGVKPWIFKQNKSKSGKRFCSNSCHGLYKKVNESGANSAQWVGGITTYRGKGWTEARRAAVIRDSGVCQDCGKVVGSSIPVHHIIPYRMFNSASKANSLENLVCLCQSCHMKVESRNQPCQA